MQADGSPVSRLTSAEQRVPGLFTFYLPEDVEVPVGGSELSWKSPP